MSWRCRACGALLCGCRVVEPAGATPPVAVVDERQLELALEPCDRERGSQVGARAWRPPVDGSPHSGSRSRSDASHGAFSRLDPAVENRKADTLLSGADRSRVFDVDVRSEIDAAARAGVRYFASGSNHPGEIVGLARCGIDVGVAIHELHSAGELAIAEAVGLGARVFVDSGAFSEVGFGPAGPIVVKPIADAEWVERLEAYVRLAQVCGERLYVVAPDQVAFQPETLARMTRFGAYVRDAASYGANVLVPVQKGAMPMAAFWRAAIAALGVPVAQLVAAIPMKKDATSTAELVTFLRDAQPARVHLLGLGPKSPRFAEIVRAVRRTCPGVELFCDSVLITSLVGRTNGRGGAPRPLTAALDAVSAELEEGLFRGDCGDVDWTEAASCPSVWLTAAGLRRFADAVGAAGASREALLADVDAWLQDDDRYLWPHVEGALEALWADYARGPGSTTWRKRESIVRLFGKTCSRGLCERCAASPAPGKHLCPAHARRWATHPKNPHRVEAAS